MKILSPAIVFLLLFAPFCNAQTLKCTRVIVGDTIELSNGETISLIGVDIPETKYPKKPVEYYVKEASAFTKKMVEGKISCYATVWNESYTGMVDNDKMEEKITNLINGLIDEFLNDYRNVKSGKGAEKQEAI